MPVESLEKVVQNHKRSRVLIKIIPNIEKAIFSVVGGVLISTGLESQEIIDVLGSEWDESVIRTRNLTAVIGIPVVFFLEFYKKRLLSKITVERKSS